MAASLFGTGNAVNVSVNGTLVQQTFTATLAQTLFTISAFTYTTGTNSLVVFQNGKKLEISRDFTETSSSSFTLIVPAAAGDFIDIIGFPLLNLTAVPAGSVTYNAQQLQSAGTVGYAIGQKIYAQLFINPGDTDFGQAVNRAILFAIQNFGGGVIEFPTSGALTITTKILVPSYIWINLNSCVITGGGFAYATPMFESAYYNGSTILTNIGTVAQSHSLTAAGVTGLGAVIKTARLILNLQDTHDTCAFGGFITLDCHQAVVVVYPFYASFKKITVRNQASTPTLPAFHFSNYNNVFDLDELFVIGPRPLAYLFDLGTYAAKITGCSAESCVGGILVNNTVNAISIKSCYFEACSGNAIELSGVSSSFLSIDVDDNWFNLCGKAVYGINCTGKFGAGNSVYSGGTNTVDFSDNSNFVHIEIPTYRTADTGVPFVPSNFLVGNNCDVSYILSVYNSGSGFPIYKAQSSGGVILPLPYFGDAGDAETGTLKFSTAIHSVASNPYNIYIDCPGIAFRNNGMNCVYNLTITDTGVGTYNLFGFVFGASVKVMDAVGKTVTASNNGGNLRLTIGTFTNATGAFVATGDVRHM